MILNFRLVIPSGITPSGVLPFLEAFVIGDCAPFSWHGNHLCLEKTGPFFSASIEMDQMEFSFKFLLKYITVEGREIHQIENKPRYHVFSGEQKITAEFSRDFFTTDYTALFEKCACLNLYKSPLISSSGELSFCCRDFNLETALGSMKDKSFFELWEGPGMNSLRLSQIRGDFRSPPCAACKNEIPAEIDVLQKFLAETGLPEILPEYCHRTLRKFYIPLYLQLEVTDLCQLSCGFCSQKYRDWETVHGRPEKGLMELPLLEKIISDLSTLPFPVRMLSLFWLGEPLLHPEFIKILDIVRSRQEKKAFYQEVEFHTNVLEFTPQFQEKLAEVVPEHLRIVFSLDACTEDTHAAVRGGDFNLIQDNISHYLKNYRHLPVRNIFQFIVTRDNLHEAKLFFEYFRERLPEIQVTAWHDWVKKDILYFRSCDPLDSRMSALNAGLHEEICGWIRTLQEHRVFFVPEYHQPESLRPSPEFRPPCSLPFLNPSIRWDGELTVCCHDSPLHNSLGNLKQDSFQKLWFEKAGPLREKMLLGDWNGLSTCKDCPFPGSANYQPFNEYYLFRFLINSGQVDLIEKYLKRKLDSRTVMNS
ncbi:MAG: SPASM domain-containing protein [Candidatus Wallbacteria bacterium]|nr:SPASM domain-containing protein [Candidatus Wallbacteria bacterium]